VADVPQSTELVVPDKGIIYPAGIHSVWTDMEHAVRDWARRPQGCTDAQLVHKWNNLRNSLLNFEAKVDD
jgi:hypothetical protein